MELPLTILLELQGIDTEIFRLKEEQENIPLEIEGAQEDMLGQKIHVEAAEDRVKEVKLTLNKKELELKEKEETIKKYDSQLSQVKTNKEYSALQGEIDNLKADCSLIEEEIIKYLDEVQSAECILSEEKGKFKQAENKFNETKKMLEEKINHNEKYIVELEEKKKSVAASLDKIIYSQYERISKSRKGVVLAPVVGEACGVCRMKMIPQKINEVLMNDKLVACDSCARILYIKKT